MMYGYIYMSVCVFIQGYTTFYNFQHRKINSMIQYMQYFSMEKFESSYGIHFMCLWAVAYALARTSPAVVAATALAGGLAVAYALRRNNFS
jgi:hypothetical protein